MNNLLKNQNLSFDEILFEGRNKSYGAYVLRQNSNRIMTKAMLFGLAFVVVVSATLFIVNQFAKNDVPITDDIFELPPPVYIDEPEKPKENPPTSPSKQEMVKVINTQVPTPSKEAKDEKPAVKQEDYKDAIAGLEEKNGIKPTETFKPPIVGVPDGIPEVKPTVPTKPKINLNEIQPKVDEKADFIDGIEVFRKKVGQNFDQYDFEGSGETMRATVSFVVERDGSISNIKATGTNSYFNKEAERTVKSIKGKWKPAKLDGENVRSYFKIPITMRFE